MQMRAEVDETIDRLESTNNEVRMEIAAMRAAKSRYAAIVSALATERDRMHFE